MSAHIENAVKLAARLYKARDAMRRLYGHDYPKKVAMFQEFIRAEMTKRKLDAINATMSLVAGLQKHDSGSGMTQALVLAAYVEMIEPSEAKS